MEAYAAGPAIARRYREQVAGADLDARAIAELARRGDGVARQIFDDTGLYLGRAIAAAANLLNPRKVVLGGGISASLDLFRPTLELTLDELVLAQTRQHLVVEPTALGYHAALLGAATVAQAQLRT